MTENKIKEFVQSLRNRVETFVNSGWAIDGLINDYTKSADTIEKLFEEIQQYRAIGTVEEIQNKMEELERWHTDRINENIKNPFAYTSTSICHNCDHKDDYIEELEAEVAEYQSIGTIDEFKALKESKCKYWNPEHEDCALSYEEIRAKAIDEFAERLKPIIDEKIKGWTNSDDLRRWCKRSIDEIAEEMRGAE